MSIDDEDDDDETDVEEETDHALSSWPIGLSASMLVPPCPEADELAPAPEGDDDDDEEEGFNDEEREDICNMAMQLVVRSQPSTPPQHLRAAPRAWRARSGPCTNPRPGKSASPSARTGDSAV